MTHYEFSRSLIGIWFGVVFLVVLAAVLPWWAFALVLVWVAAFGFVFALCGSAGRADQKIERMRNER